MTVSPDLYKVFIGLYMIRSPRCNSGHVTSAEINNVKRIKKRKHGTKEEQKVIHNEFNPSLSPFAE